MYVFPFNIKADIDCDILIEVMSMKDFYYKFERHFFNNSDNKNLNIPKICQCKKIVSYCL